MFIILRFNRQISTQRDKMAEKIPNDKEGAEKEGADKKEELIIDEVDGRYECWGEESQRHLSQQSPHHKENVDP